MSQIRRALMMASLVLAGESIYMLPYALRREYEPVLTRAMGMSGIELGWLTAVFGVFALFCYLPGGWLADRVSARTLITLSLVSTGLGGLYMATFPGYVQLVALHAFWGVTTILTFWGALIKATRGWGGDAEQGRAFGILEGGRGLVAFGLASVGGLLFARFDTGPEALRTVILLYSCVVLATGALTWLFIPPHPDVHSPDSPVEIPARQTAHGNRLRRVLSMPIVWLQAIVIFTAYAGYWGTFDLARLAVDGFGATDATASAVSLSAVFWRALMALSAGFVADRFGASRTVLASFGLLFAACAAFVLAPAGPGLMWLLWLDAALLGAAAYALRGVFYALLDEARIPMDLTGVTVGVVSVVGYAPDVLVPVLKGWLTDTHSGVTGHRYFFAVLAACALFGAAATLGIQRLSRQASEPSETAS